MLAGKLAGLRNVHPVNAGELKGTVTARRTPDGEDEHEGDDCGGENLNGDHTCSLVDADGGVKSGFLQVLSGDGRQLVP